MRLARMIQAVDAHAAGEPGRVIVGGVLDVPGRTTFDKSRHLEEHGDALRKCMLREPRGYPGANCNLILPPTHPDADAAFVIMEHVEYPGMSGTNTICVATVLLETGMVPMREPVTELTLEAPAGLIRVRAECAGGKVKSVTFQNVPAFAVYLDRPIEVPKLGTVTVDVAYGGMFYAIADARAFGLKLTPDEGRDIVRITEMIKTAAREQLPVTHPEQPGFTGISIAQLSGPPSRPDAHMKNVVTVSTGALDWNRPSTWTGVIDRSPCGT
jgi:proline racemase